MRRTCLSPDFDAVSVRETGRTSHNKQREGVCARYNIGPLISRRRSHVLFVCLFCESMKTVGPETTGYTSK